VATKTGKQGPELVSRVAELEAENAGQARQVEELRVALDEVQQQAREKILEEKRKAKQVGGTVEELTQTLSSALDELKVRLLDRWFPDS
jgi:predicted RNase H-like nuclease (RuvC/YqgF family)